ncbi:hypothetical protein QL285_082844 [Trifolium repens]|nr:hypothetical protein QL285_082844 [Trifolium repens]
MEVDDTQYPRTFFYENDLYPGNKMKVQFSKRPFARDGNYTQTRGAHPPESTGETRVDWVWVRVRVAPDISV